MNWTRVFLPAALAASVGATPALVAAEETQPKKRGTITLDGANTSLKDELNPERRAPLFSNVGPDRVERDLCDHCDHDPALWTDAPNV